MPEFNLTIKMDDPSDLHAIAAAADAYLNLHEKGYFDPDGFFKFLTILFTDGLSDPEAFYVHGIVESVPFREIEIFINKLRESANAFEQRLEYVRATTRGDKNA